MPVITLPDGSQKQFDHPVTVDEVAASIGAGLRKAALAGRIDEARRKHQQLAPLMDANFLESNPAPVKAALALMGRIEPNVRLPLVPVQPGTTAALKSALSVLSDLSVK